MLSDAGPAFKDGAARKNGFVSIGHVIPAVSFSRAGPRPIFPYGPRFGVIQKVFQETGESFGTPGVERQSGASRDFFVFRSRVVARDTPIA
jgi:hypothetical protein